MTHEQMLAAQRMLPQPGDDPDMAMRRMEQLQSTMDPLRNRMLTLPGAALKPSYRDDPNSGYNQQRNQNNQSQQLPTFRRDPASKKVQQSTDGGRTWN
jgi:hypothetical protein